MPFKGNNSANNNNNNNKSVNDFNKTFNSTIKNSRAEGLKQVSTLINSLVSEDKVGNGEIQRCEFNDISCKFIRNNR